MKVFYIALFTFISSFLAFSVAAQPVPSEKPPVFNIKCKDKSSPAAEMGCLTERVLFARHMLNQIYTHIQSNVTSRELLNASQNSWVVYRDQTCKLQASLEDEAYQRSKELECIGKLTEERTLFLFNLQNMMQQHDALNRNEQPTILSQK
jgi:uncharacterized protein YecT (DUF1311 family)